MVSRDLTPLARQFAAEFKVVAILGPRQSGKTTLARELFAGKPYANLEAPDTLSFAQEDPRGFLASHPDGMVIDEAQRCPALFSYIQTIVDERRAPGQYILTGSQHFGMMESITQSLAGRVGLLRLLPFSWGELRRAPSTPSTLEEALFKGGYPPLYDQPLDPARWLDAYVATYIERDVRQIVNVRDLTAFQRFVRVCAGNVGQLLNLSRIGADVGIDAKTAAAWLGIMEGAFLCFRLAPYHRNFRKRLVKSPKLYFHDTATVVRLLGVESSDQLLTHPLRGALFENWVVSELLKGQASRGRPDGCLSFWRSSDGHEVDVVAEAAGSVTPIEIKSGATVASDWLRGVLRWSELADGAAATPILVYGGDEAQTRQGVKVTPWREIDSIANAL